MITITQRCPADHPCPLVRICPENAISQPVKNGLPVIDRDRCIECGICVDSCPQSAVEQG
jgi:ferredoxin